MSIQFWAVVGYVVITAAIGILAGMRKGRGVSEFFVAGAQLPWYLVTPFLAAEFVTTTATVGVAEMAHELGVASLLYFIGYACGIPLFVLGIVKFYVSIRKITIGEAFAVLFDRKTRLACVLFILVCTTLTTAVGYLGLGTILAPSLNIPYESGVWLGMAALLVIALAGGLRGIAWMNVVHIVVIIVCFIPATVAAVSAAGGLGHLIASLPPEHLNWLRPGGFTVAAWLISSALMRVISTLAVTAMFAAKNETHANISVVASSIFIVLFTVMPALIGLSAYVIMPDITSRTALWEMGEYSGMTISVIISLGVLAAIISTTPGLILTLGGMATRDFFRLVKPDASEGAQLLFSRIAMIVLTVGGTLFALTQRSILGFIVDMAQVRGILAVVLIISVFWRRIHPAAAFWSIVLGAGSGFIWFFANSPLGIEPLWPALTIGILTLIIISLKRKPSPYKGAERLELPNKGGA